MSQPPSIASKKPAPGSASTLRKRRRPILRTFLGLILTFTAALIIPQSFQLLIATTLRVEAWRHGGSLRLDRVEGSLWEPVTLSRAYLELRPVSGGTTRVEAATVELLFAWKALFQGSGERLFTRASFRGVMGKIEIPLDSEKVSFRERTWRDWFGWSAGTSLPLPQSLEVEGADLVFQSDLDYARVEGGRLRASANQPGEVMIERLTINQPWLQHTFRNVSGKAALQGDRIALANVVVQPGITVLSLTAELGALAHGELAIDGEVAAFDGRLQAEAATRHVGESVLFEAAGAFSQINIGKLASFLALSDAAGGIIKDGKFTFRGPPRDLARSQGSLRFDAVNFQWETRQWDSLTLGLVVMDRRLQLPQLDLKQGKNELHLTGELALPESNRNWWQGEFNTTVDARIENLTDLSALLLPEFKYAAGRVTIEGSVRGRGEEFNGQLLVAGSKMTWRNAPIETLHAAVKLSGKEIQIVNVELINRDEYLRGRGLVKLTHPTVYWGELRLDTKDLATYSAFLQKPVLPEPLAGGAIIDWTGEGSSAGHSGKFLARLSRLRPSGPLAQQFHPLNADLEATYGADNMRFSRFALSDEDSSFTANVAVGGKALHLQDVRFSHRGIDQLQGDALLPLDVWQKWPDVAPSQLLAPDVVAHVSLAADKLDLAALSELTGWRFPLAGLLTGNISADGAVGALKLGGRLDYSGGRLPLGWSGEIIERVDAQIGFKENAVVIEKLTGRHSLGCVEMKGEVGLQDVFKPILKLGLRSDLATLRIFDGSLRAEARVDLDLEGAANAATLTGRILPLGVELETPLDLGPVWRDETYRVPAFMEVDRTPWSAWPVKLSVKSSGPVPVKGTSGSCEVTLDIGGTLGHPAILGSIQAQGLPLEPTPLGELRLDRATVEFSSSTGIAPSFDLNTTGDLAGLPFRANLSGAGGFTIRTLAAPAPTEDRLISELLWGTYPGTAPLFMLELPKPPLAGGAAKEAPGVASEPNRLW